MQVPTFELKVEELSFTNRISLASTIPNAFYDKTYCLYFNFIVFVFMNI